MATALVTGASAGIGEVFARRLARSKHDLVLVARRLDRLQAIAEALSDTYAVRCDIIPADLSQPGAATAVMAILAERGLQVDLLVNNAGFGIFGPFADQSPERLAQMIAVNIAALTDLTRLVLPGMRERSRGAILNVASLAAFQAVPSFAAYAASKAYVLHFSEALAEELRGTGVTVTCLCPGSTATEFGAVAQVEISGAERFTQSPEAVVDEALAGLARGQAVVVTGQHNRLSAALSRLAPRGLATRTAAYVMGRRRST
ncbi:MAG: SDR family oxidoreductase [Cyanobacteria bacterium REEB65]|nr:SDR family oxidoreductase [Cyanobacteria bacterium REEB65]